MQNDYYNIDDFSVEFPCQAVHGECVKCQEDCSVKAALLQTQFEDAVKEGCEC